MEAGIWRGLDRAARHAMPAAALLLAMIVLAIPLLPFGAVLRASVATTSVFFWSLYRPQALPAPVTMASGLVLGLLDASPLGLWAVLLLLEQAVVLRLRRRLAETRFLRIWLVFAVLAVGIGVLGWLARCLLALALLPEAPAAVETAAAILLYPLAASLLGRAHRGPAAPERA